MQQRISHENKSSYILFYSGFTLTSTEGLQQHVLQHIYYWGKGFDDMYNYSKAAKL